MHGCVAQAAADSSGDGKGINQRTGKPYVRGAYNKEKSESSAAQIAKLAKQAAAAAKAADADKKATAAADKTAAAAKAAAEQIKALQAENARLVEALASQKAAAESEKKAAIFEASHKAAEQMLQRYKDGLRDGATLSRGSLGPVNLSGAASATPDSHVGSSGTPTGMGFF